MKIFSIINRFKIVLLLPICLWWSCSDLEENPNFTSPANFYQNENDALIAVNGIYDDLGRHGEDWMNMMYGRFVFDCVLGYSRGYEKEPLNLNNGSYTADNWVTGDYWKISYRMINSANNAIAKIPAIQMDENLKTRLIAEATFLRGFAYYYLAVYYDDVPVYTEPTEDVFGAKGNENGKELALQQAISDFTAAAEVLPPSYEAQNLGRATKWAALGYLAKAYLETGQYPESLAASQRVIDESDIELFEDYSDNFALETENMGERIFELQSLWSSTKNDFTNIHAHFTPTDWAGPNCDFQTTSASGWADAWIYGAPEFRATYDPDDKRIQGTFIEQYCSRNTGDSPEEYEMVSWDINAEAFFVGKGSPERTYRSAYIVKYLEPEIENYNYASRNFPFLRYADVLLTNSEAANEAGQGDPYYGLNLVRKRAGLEALSGLNQDQLREAILQENIFEFAFEGQTFITLKRAGEAKFKEFAEKYLPRPFEKKDMAIPIPLQEINANTNLKQHPYWR